jgi:putative tryptophan/tyrosine transport system substrate-binding protein
MRCRDFITLLGGAAATWPLAAGAQQGERMRRIGVLVSGSEGDPEMQARLAGFREGLKRFGWTEGDNLRIDYRYASASAERSQALARELVALRPDAVLAFASISAVALQRESRALPIVFVGIPDPIGHGLIASLAHPGGNLTGSLLYEPTIVGKWLAMLKELAPQLTRVAILFNRKTSPYPYYEPTANAIAPSLAIELVPMHVEIAAEIERAIESFARVPNGGLLVPPDLTAVLHRDLVIALAARHRLPAVYQARFWVAAGGLMSYGADRVAEHRHAAYYVDRILRGANPADLPVQAPTKFETTLNLRTAKALGLTVPPGLLVAADEVIE